MSVSQKAGLPVAKILGAMLLAGVASGCSSDATRFSAIFTDSDPLTTNSVPRRTLMNMRGQAPVPARDVASGGMVAPAAQPDYNSRQQALSQPYPGQSPAYDPMSTSTTSPGVSRMPVAPASVQRTELSAPRPTASAARDAALAQPFPSAPGSQETAARTPVVPDPVVTGQTQRTGAAPMPLGAARVTLARGETVSILAKRHGVSEQAILQANGMTSSAEAATGQSLIIPNAGIPGASARAAADPATLPGNVPLPRNAPEQKVAVLPGTNATRDKGIVDAAGKPVPTGAGGTAGAGGTYVVKEGDTLNKIAKATGTPINALKEANGLTNGGIRIGQTLKLPGGASTKADPVKTASVPPKAETPKPAPAASQPQPTKTVSDAVSADTKDAAPEATGIGKYRWPVRGAVVASYGQNVEGKRNDGIDISVPVGTPVKAAENGVVIYAGNGLKELGNTVLVRHDDGTVTVYGHADAISVQRGQKVQRGQQVATSGMSGNVKRPLLHFQVRKDATPVNPMGFLE